MSRAGGAHKGDGGFVDLPVARGHGKRNAGIGKRELPRRTFHLVVSSFQPRVSLGDFELTILSGDRHFEVGLGSLEKARNGDVVATLSGEIEGGDIDPDEVEAIVDPVGIGATDPVVKVHRGEHTEF